MQAEVANKKPCLHTVGECSAKLKPHLTPQGLSQVSEEQLELQRGFSDLTEQTKNRTLHVTEVIKERKAYWNKWDNFDSWLSGTDKQLTSTAEIYSDEIPSTITKLEVSEYTQRLKWSY